MDGYLGIYMNDQLALGVLWREVARRAQRQNRGTELGGDLARVAAGIADDVELFALMMERLGIRRSRVKPMLARIAEWAGRLKLNGKSRGYSPLSRFVELDVLAIGIDGKKLLWATLRDLAGLRELLPDVDFDRLIARAEQQRALIEPHRAAAGRNALAARRTPTEG